MEDAIAESRQVQDEILDRTIKRMVFDSIKARAEARGWLTVRELRDLPFSLFQVGHALFSLEEENLIMLPADPDGKVSSIDDSTPIFVGAEIDLESHDNAFERES